MNIIIYGAQGYALGAYKAIHSLYPRRKIVCFLVTQRGANADCLSGIPVLELGEYAKTLSEKEKAEAEILIATPENVMPEIEGALDEYGLYCHTRLTSERWARLMSYYYAKTGQFTPIAALPEGVHCADVQVFMAKFYKDRALSSAFRVPDWITPVQVGAVLCEERVAELLDSEGDNISGKNVNYSELTALYWMWRNRLGDIVAKEAGKTTYFGLVHYRRILDLSDDDLCKLVDNDIDAVLPYPMPYEPNIEMHHKRYLKDADWNALLKAIEELQPEYANAFPAILSQQYMYNYNIIVARGRVLADYCSWLFPILERTEELSIPKGSERADRYIGYMGEMLTTLYFLHNRDKLDIVHAGCRFLT